MTTNSGTIENDVPSVDDGGALSEDDAADVMLKRWTTDAKTPSETGKEATVEEEGETPAPRTEEDDNAEEGEGSEDDAEGEAKDDDDKAEKKEPAKKIASDDDEVEVTVDGEAKKLSVKDLKRLAGQEAALTRKSQEVATARKLADDVGQKHQLALGKMLDRAQERYKPYAELDLLVAQKTMSAEDFAQLRADMKAAHEDVRFFTEEAERLATEHRETATKRFREAAQDAIKVLSDEKTGIPGWNQQLYNDIRSFAVEQGMSPDTVNGIIDPAAIKMLHLAMKFVQSQKVAIAKVAKAPKNLTKNTRQTSGKDATLQRAEKATERLRKSGTTDDVEALLLARWGANS